MSGRVRGEDYDAAIYIANIGDPHMPCSYCGLPMVNGDPNRRPTRDHIWPKSVRSISEGRTGTVWCCAECNNKKGDMMPSEWLHVINPPPTS